MRELVDINEVYHQIELNPECVIHVKKIKPLADELTKMRERFVYGGHTKKCYDAPRLPCFCERDELEEQLRAALEASDD